MPDSIEELKENGSLVKRRFDARDWDHVGEFVIQEYERRKTSRADRERHWKDIDRQIAMEPDCSFKKLSDGRVDARKLWMSEMELPLQAQALEVCTADARRLMFARDWFSAHAEMTDDYLAKVDFQALILGDKAEVPSTIDQDNADKLVEGFIYHLLRQYDFYSRYDRINAESFKYGMGVGRGRMQAKNVYIHEARGVRKEKQKIPVIVPVSIKNLYLDEPMPSMHSATVLGDSHIAEDWIKYANLVLAASKGSDDPYDEDGGWMPANLKGLEPDDNGLVHLLEIEGDIVIPRKTVRSFILPSVIITVAIGGAAKGGDVTRSVVRARFRKAPFSSYLLHPYHYEGANEAYPTSPLEKGRPIQIMATDALNRLMDSAALKNAPPIGYDKNSMAFGMQGGPNIQPHALWETIDPVNVYDEVGGDPAALSETLRLAISLYAELTGVLPSRLGAQTVSHTTAFAKDAELQRGAIRTVDYVEQIGHGALTRWLYMAYEMGRNALSAREGVSFFIEAYGGFVNVNKSQLPERAMFEWFGSGGPAEEQQKRQMKIQALQLAIQMDQLGMQMGRPPSVNLEAAIQQTLREGGWTDIDTITEKQTALGQQAPNPGAQSVALQQIGLAAA